ncbi:MAG: outer rane autotransporter [Phycisphaerales bacterium]|nr:outer rane autotransporter [Phycisphaerales bacterium]
MPKATLPWAKLAFAITAALPAVATRGAGVLTWDSAPATSGLQGGSGTWVNGGAANWYNGTANVAWNNATLDTARFGVNSSPTAPTATISISGTATARYVVFDASAYVITGGQLTLGSGAGIDNGVTTNVDGTIASNITTGAGVDGWFKDGAGTLTLQGNNVTAPLTVSAGTLAFTSAQNLPSFTRLKNFARLSNGIGGDIATHLTIGASATDGGTIDIPNAAKTVQLTGLMDGAGTLVKSGAGTLSLVAPNAVFGGQVRVDAGTLRLTDNNRLNSRPITLNGGTLRLVSDVDYNFASPLTTQGTGSTISLYGGTSKAATLALPSLKALGDVTLDANDGWGLSVGSLTNGSTINLNNAPLTVTGPAVNLTGTYRFGHNFTNAAPGARGLWVANSGSNVITANFAGQAEDADLLVGVAGAGAAVSSLTLNGTWRGGGGSATSTLALTNSAQLNISPSLHFNTLSADRTQVHLLGVAGAGSARSTLQFDPNFVADHTNGGAIDDGLGQIRLRDVTWITHNTQSLPIITKLVSPGGPTQRYGSISFYVIGGVDSGARWIVRTNDQSYDGFISTLSNAEIRLEKNLTATGRVVQYSDNIFYIAPNQTLNLSGPGTLTLSGDLGFGSNSVLNTNDATVVFNTDPGAGWLLGRYSHNADGTVNAPATPVAYLTLNVGSGAAGSTVFNAPASRLVALNVSTTAVMPANTSVGAPHLIRIGFHLGVTHAANHYLDLTNNALIVQATSDKTLAGIRDMIFAGDIRSSLADSAHSLAYAQASQVGVYKSGLYHWLTEDLAGNDTVVRYTLNGDIDMNGVVDFNDLAKLAQSYNTTAPAGTPGWWYRGDFTGDGVTDFLDLAKLAQNYNTSLTPAAAVPGASADFNADLARAFASVPEPSAALLASLAACGFAPLLRRRRRSR